MLGVALLLAFALGGSPPAAAAPASGAAAQGRSSAIPFREDRPIDFDAGRIAAAFGLAIAAALAALYAMRRRLHGSAPGAGRRLRLIERLRVSPRSSILLVECDGETLLLGEHAGGLVRLGSGRPAPMVEPADAVAPVHGRAD